jgi:acetyl-CoA carboxylase carboxyl transferase subunit alpha
MSAPFLDFEKKIVELEKKLEELRALGSNEGADLSAEIKKIHKKINQLKEETFSNLTSWQRTQLARHPARPYALDYINEMTDDFLELHGDRCFGDGPSIIGGFATMDGKPIMVIGQQKGRDTKEKMYRNFGMSHPEGYRKGLRLMKLAEKFLTPIIILIDTPGAYPGIGAEQRGQAEAIAKNMLEMAKIRVPIICVVIGEGSSGGAIGLGIGNKVLMMEYSIYPVISPEGCAAILWKDQAKTAEAAEALSLTSKNLLEQGIIDEIIQEPVGGAHRNSLQAAHKMRRVLRRHIGDFSKMDPEEIIAQRRRKFRQIGSVLG